MSAQDLDQGQDHAHHSTEGDEHALDSTTELDQLMLYISLAIRIDICIRINIIATSYGYWILWGADLYALYACTSYVYIHIWIILWLY